MKYLQTGNYFGVRKKVIELPGLILSDTETLVSAVPWHYHENAYFTYFLKGSLLDIGKQHRYECVPGTIVFHNNQEPHYNCDGKQVHALHVEIKREWFGKHSLKPTELEGSSQLHNPALQVLFDKMHHECRINDRASALSLEGLMLQVIAELKRGNKERGYQKPSWLHKLKDYIHDHASASIKLEDIALELNLHPSYISAAFSRHFSISFGEYARLVKVQKAAGLLATRISLSQIAYECGFADQSHFTRCFKTVYGITPLAFRKSTGGIRLVPKAEFHSILEN